MTTTISRQDQQLQQHQPLQAITSSSEVVGGGAGVVGGVLAESWQFDSLNNNNNSQATQDQDEPQKRRSLLNFKSLDFHLKSLYTGLRGSNTSQPANSSAPAVDQPQRRMPYLRVESVDPEAEVAGEGHPIPGHSPSFLSPYTGAVGGAVSLQLPSADAATIRRSSTSDIVNCRRGGGAAGSGPGGGGGPDSRRPSTSDLLRRARERKGSEARMGRSVSHSGLTRGGAFGGGGGLGGRRTSMAF